LAAVQHKFPPRDRIVTAARHLFATQGFHQTPMSELAITAQVSVGLIYRNFTSKNDIISAIVAEDTDVKAKAMATLLDDVKSGSLTIMAGFVQLAIQSMSEKNEALSFEILAEAYRNSNVAELISEVCTRFRHAIRELSCIANPALSAKDLDGAEEFILGLMFGLGHSRLSRPQLTIQDRANQAGRMIIASLSYI
jgi:TetR/AcrR family transcriptional repressor of uid operon